MHLAHLTDNTVQHIKTCRVTIVDTCRIAVPQAEVERLRADLEQLQQASEASASALTDRDALWKEELLRAQRDLQSSQAQVVVSCTLPPSFNC